MYICVGMCTRAQGPTESRREYLGPLDRPLQVVILGTKLRSSTRGGRALNHGATHPAYIILILIM